jgi:hypothetical protein
MGMMKNYLLTLLHQCSEHQFGQDAIEWGIASGFVKLTYDLETDLRLIMGEPGQPETGCYSELVEAFQRLIRQDWESGDEELLEEILRTR